MRRDAASRLQTAVGGDGVLVCFAHFLSVVSAMGAGGWVKLR